MEDDTSGASNAKRQEPDVQPIRSNQGQSQGTKRSADNQNAGSDAMEWLDQLVDLAKFTGDVILSFEPDAHTTEHDVAEVFSPPRVVTIARRSGLKGGWSIDRLIEKQPGEKWDLTRRAHQLAVLQLIQDLGPRLAAGFHK